MALNVTPPGTRLTVAIRPALLLFALLTLLLSAAPATPPASASPESSPAPVTPAESGPAILIATIHSVDVASGTVSLLTGRGHALRIVQFSLPSGASISRKGATLALSDLKPGAILRVRFTGAGPGGIGQAAEVEVQ
jgi:hypothetical protein